jgi:cytochrome c oxidase assembly factor CtaG
VSDSSFDGVHALQHVSFLGSALLFWGALIRGHMGKDSYGSGLWVRR